MGSSCNPIPIVGFPYVDNTRDTTNAPGREIASYSCAPATDESGPEFFYVMDLPNSGTLTVSVVDAVGVDIDIHLLDSTTADSCITRHDRQFSIPVVAGRYYLVLDTWVDANFVELVGPYTLTVDFI